MDVLAFKEPVGLIAIDLDGTLLGSNHMISNKTVEVIHQARQEGLTIVLCTGRPLAGVVPYLKRLDMKGPDDYVITFNGGLIQQGQDGRVLKQYSLTYAELCDLVDLSRQIDLPLVAVDMKEGFLLDNGINTPSLYPDMMPFIDFHQLGLADLSQTRLFQKVLLARPEAELDKAVGKIPAAYAQRYEIIRSRRSLLEVVPKGVSKGAALKTLAEWLHIPMSQTMAIGDEENDLTMLKAAGYGVVMANGAKVARDLADYITKSNDEDGVAYVVEQVLTQQAYQIKEVKR